MREWQEVCKLTDEWVHRFGSAADDDSNEDEPGADESDIATADQIGK